MKKVLALLVAVVGLAPFAVSAKTVMSHVCSIVTEGVYSCEVSVNIESPTSELTVVLTEKGGAQVTEINEASDWYLNTVGEGPYTLTFSSSTLEELVGEYDLFRFTYSVSGESDCGIALEFEGQTSTINPDQPSGDKPTGATLPYIALGAIALCAAGAYLATKNKSKMYRI